MPLPPVEHSADLAGEELELFGATLAELRASGKAPGKQQGLTFLLSLIAFVVFGAGFNSVESLLLLIPVLLVHELGHLLAMRVFGYKDLGVFFIPLFGAAATGRKERAPAWEQVIVSLMGPAPGLLLAFGLAIAFRGEEPHPLLEQLVGLTLVLNALNLLPFEPFDGGRVASIVLFGGHPRLRVVFAGLSSLGLAALAAALGSWVLGVVALLGLLTIARRYRMASCAALLRARLEPQSAPPRVADAPDDVLRSVVVDWREGSEHGLKRDTSQTLASVVARVYELAMVPRAGLGARLALGVAYFALLVPSALVVSKMLD